MSFDARIHQARFPQPSWLRANGSIATGLSRATELVGGSILWFSCAGLPLRQSALNLRPIARRKSRRDGSIALTGFARGSVVPGLRGECADARSRDANAPVDVTRAVRGAIITRAPRCRVWLPLAITGAVNLAVLRASLAGNISLSSSSAADLPDANLPDRPLAS